MIGGTWLNNSPWASFGFAAFLELVFAVFHWNQLGWQGGGVLAAALIVGMTTSARFQKLQWQEAENHAIAPLTVLFVGLGLGFAPVNEVLGALLGLTFLSYVQAFFKRSKATRDYFLAGVWAAIAALVSHQGVVWLALSASAVVFTAVFSFRVVATWISGLMLPIYLYLAFRFITGDWVIVVEFWEGYSQWLGSLAFKPMTEIETQFWVGFVALAIFAMIGLAMHGFKLLPRERPFLRNVGLLFAIAIIMLFVVSYASFPERLISLLPFVVVGIASLIQSLKPLVRETFVVILFLLAGWVGFHLQ